MPKLWIEPNACLAIDKMCATKLKSLFEAVQPPARSKLSDLIVSQIERLMLEGALKPGDMLPPEREFAERLQVSRPSLREALLKLEARGLISARRGGGYAVADVTAPTLTDPIVHLLQQHPSAAYDILELRHGLEEIAAYFAATRATEADRQEITRRFKDLENLEGKGDETAAAEADLEFHMALADASHNIALMHVMRGLMNLFRKSTSRFRDLITALHDGSSDVLRDQHLAVYDAVMKRDAPAAREAVHLHLSFIEATLREFDRDEGSTPVPQCPTAVSKTPATKKARSG